MTNSQVLVSPTFHLHQNTPKVKKTRLTSHPIPILNQKNATMTLLGQASKKKKKNWIKSPQTGWPSPCHPPGTLWRRTQGDRSQPLIPIRWTPPSTCIIYLPQKKPSSTRQPLLTLVAISLRFTFRSFYVLDLDLFYIFLRFRSLGQGKIIRDFSIP